MNLRRENILLFLMGFFVFSSFSSLLLIEWLHFPLSLPEILFVPFFYFLRYKFDIKVLRQPLAFVLFVLWLVLVFITLICEYSPPYETLGSARTYLYIFIFYILFSKSNKLGLEDMMYIAFGSLFGWSVTCYFNLGKFTVDESGITYGAMLAIPIVVSTSLLTKKWGIFLFTCILLLFIGFTAALRRQMFVTVLTFGAFLLFSSVRNKKAGIITFVTIIVAVFVIYVFSPFIRSTLAYYTPRLYQRTFERTETLLSEKGTEVGSDTTRINIIKGSFIDAKQYLVPHGYVSNYSHDYNAVINAHNGRFNDIPLLELEYVFGGIFAFLIVGYFVFLLFKNIVFYFFDGYMGNLIAIISGIAMLSLLFLEGSFIKFPYLSIFTGYCLGILKFYSVVSINKKYNV